MTAPNHDPSPRLSPASPLVKFHKLLITAGIVFLLRYAPLEFRHYAQSGAVQILARSVVAVAAALALGVHLRRFMRSLGH